MNSDSNEPGGGDTARIETLPGGLADGGTFLVASAGDPTRHAVSLRLLYRCGRDDDVALVVTTTESAERTVDAFDRVCRESGRPSLRLVDTVSERQSVSAPYGETPVVFTPSSDDIERLVLALSELSDGRRGGNRHVLCRSLSPFLDAMTTDRVCRVVDRLSGVRSERGLCLLGFDYTAHDRRTMRAIAERVDGVLWTERRSSDSIELEYRPTHGRYDAPDEGPPTGD